MAASTPNPSRNETTRTMDPTEPRTKSTPKAHWRRIVGALALLAAVVLVLRQWHSTRKVDLTVVVILEHPVRSVTIRLLDAEADKDDEARRTVRLEGTPGTHDETFSVPAGDYMLVLRTERLDGTIEQTKRRVSLKGDAKLTVRLQ